MRTSAGSSSTLPEESAVDVRKAFMSYQEHIRKCATHIVVVKTSLSGFDVTVWLQHLVLVPQMCSDRP